MAADSLAERFSKVRINPAGGGENAPMSGVRRKKNFSCMELVKGRMVNILEGLELHAGVFSAAEQRQIVDCVYDFQEKGRRGLLRERTFSEPRKWMRGKGRVTIQFGCCYNYATDRSGNPPGIIRDEEVDPIPPLLKKMIKRMVEWHVLPPTCVPNSCIVNIYDKDDCIPPHIDHHDFLRPFCTVSFLTECNILFGKELKVLGPGEFSGAASIPLPVGSVLVLKGNGADLAKHCVPAVPGKRISITFRKMDDSKLPFKFSPDPELQNLVPLRTLPSAANLLCAVQQQARLQHRPGERAQASSVASLTSTMQQQPKTQQARSLAVGAASLASGTPQQPAPPQGQAAFRQGTRMQRPLQHLQVANGACKNSSNTFNLVAEDFPALGSSLASGSGRRR